MAYIIPAKPTMYNGRLFRSRLEARWQCMFDKLGWQAEYEPCQINGFNPDFIIKSTSYSYPTKTIIVEVKPSPMIDDNLINSTYQKYENVKSHILILSDSPFHYTTTDDYIHVGIGSQYYGETTTPTWEGEDEIFGTWHPPTERSHMHNFQMKGIDDFSSENMIWDGMISGKVERKQFITHRYYESRLLSKMWATAGNETQFKVNGRK